MSTHYRSRYRIAGLVIGAGLLVSTGVAPATAGPVTIDRGYLDISGTSGPLVLSGTRGFSLQTRVDTSAGRFDAASCNTAPQQCVPGATLDLYAAWSGSGLAGRVTLEGVEYDPVNEGGTPSTSLAVAFVGSVTLPPINSQSAAVGALFDFTGTFTHGDVETLSGRASVTVHLEQHPHVPGSWRVTRVWYDFGIPVPSTWSSHDIGAATSGGSALFVDGTFGVSAAGRDIWDTQDAFRFTAHRSAHVRAIAARVREQRSANHFAKAGVMLRKAFDPGSPHVVLNLTPDGEIEFMARTTWAGPTTWIAGAPAISARPWLQLVHVGHSFLALQSADGRQWQRIASAVLPISPALLGGLVVTSHDTGVYDFVLFDNVTVDPAALASDNLLTGGDFEKYQPPDLGLPSQVPGVVLSRDWVSDDYRGTVAVTERAHPHTGVVHARCTTTAARDCGVYQELLAPMTAAYTYRFFAWADRPGALAGVDVNGGLAASVPLPVTAEYDGGAVSFSATAGDLIRVWMYAPVGPTTLRIDDTALTLAIDHDTLTDGTWTVLDSPPPQARFAVSGPGTSVEGRWEFGQVAPGWVCRPCRPGALVDLSATFDNLHPLTSASAAGGSATIDGQMYPSLEFGGALALMGGVTTVPTPTGADHPERLTVSTRFVADGVLRGYEVTGLRDPRLVFERPFSGSGTVYLDLLSGPGPDGPVLSFHRLRYVFGDPGQ